MLNNTFFSLKGVQNRPVSVATEFMESDFDDDEILSDFDDGENSPRVSLDSGQPSFTTASSFDEVQTPRSSRMPVEYHMAMEHTKQVEGPRGPHLFRISTLSAEFENALSLSPITPKVPKMDALLPHPVALPHGITPLPSKKTQTGAFRFTSEKLDTKDLVSWSPEMISQWMLNAGIELQVCEHFVENDITGGILMTLKFEDLKELGIPSFGVRLTVWNQINAMKNVPPANEVRPETPIEDAPDRHVRRELRHHDSASRPLRRRPSSRRKKTHMDYIVTPLESVSIVGIEQVMPKPHQCSKGENCSKWKRNQRMMEAFKREHPFVHIENGGIVMIAGDPGNPETAKSLFPHTNTVSEENLRPISDMVPSVVASSDVLGPGTLPSATQALQEDMLRSVQTRDPQDNVRQFLDFQHQHGTASNEVPPTPPFELYPPVHAGPIEGLRALPRLCIPAQTRRSPNAAGQTAGKQSSPARPSQGSAQPPPSAKTVSAAPTSSTSYTHTAMEESPDRTPHAFYRFGTPFSEMDVPVTTVPVGPVAREVSQSVPPDMNYRAPLTRTMSRASARRPSFPVLPSLDENRATAGRPAKLSSHHRSPSAKATGRKSANTSPTGAAAPAAAAAATTRPLHAPPRVKYPWSPERATFETAIAPSFSTVLGQSADTSVSSLSSTMASASASASSSSVASGSLAGTASTSLTSLMSIGTRDAEGVTYQGAMKKRKTKMLRHEWHDRYVTLRGTRLAMHKDARTVDRTLEYIDIDDYAIACSSMAASTSKLNAAFKAMNIRRGSDGLISGHNKADVAAFSFQLIPQDSRGGMRLRKRDSAPPPGAAGVASLSAAAAAAVGAAGASAAAPVPRAGAAVATPPPPPPADAVNGTGKTHHFAVKSRDERIEWMRELMLAKAMRQKGEGFEVRVNGNMI